MTGDRGSHWSWFADGAIQEFKRWRRSHGATTGSAASYATGARAFVDFCRRTGLPPPDAVESFFDELTRTGELTKRACSDYRSHARAFVRFLRWAERVEAEVVPSPGLGSVPATASAAQTAAPSDSEPVTRQRSDGSADWLEALEGVSTADLLAGYARTLAILRHRGVLRTANAPLGDYAEWLVWRAFGGVIEPNSTKSHDITDAIGRRLQVKARLVSQPAEPGQLQTSVFRSWEFDFAVLIQLAQSDYSVVRASLVPVELFEGGAAHAKWSGHVRGWLVYMTPMLMAHPAAVDVTERLGKLAIER